MNGLLTSKDALLDDLRQRLAHLESEYEQLAVNRYTLTKEEAWKWQHDKIEAVESTLFKGIQILNIEKGMRVTQRVRENQLPQTTLVSPNRVVETVAAAAIDTEPSGYQSCGKRKEQSLR